MGCGRASGERMSRTEERGEETEVVVEKGEEGEEEEEEEEEPRSKRKDARLFRAVVIALLAFPTLEEILSTDKEPVANLPPRFEWSVRWDKAGWLQRKAWAVKTANVQGGQAQRRPVQGGGGERGHSAYELAALGPPLPSELVPDGGSMESRIGVYWSWSNHEPASSTAPAPAPATAINC
ncbi:hypothetical protein G7046_g6752 [Stylonectria norvegica]|nr:hypothetical protein G7046_g6752 [Stylonectria norvegica]